MNKVEQIKAEIESLYNKAKEEPYTLRVEGKLEALDKLDAFIDSLEEESKFKIGDKVHCGDVTQPITITGMRDDAYFTDSALGVILFSEQDNWELVEEPVNEDLQKFADEWDESLYRSDAVIAGANWQKEKMMKDAVDCTIIHHPNNPFNNYSVSAFIPITHPFMEYINHNDKVKIIIVK